MRNINSTGTVDPNTLNLDPETEVGSNLDPDPRVNLSIWKMVKLVLEQTSANNLIFFIKKIPVLENDVSRKNSTKLLSTNTDTIWIRIHNTEKNYWHEGI